MKHTILFTDGVVKRTGMSGSWISREVEKSRKGQGNFPLPISPFKSKRRRLEYDIDRWLESLSSINDSLSVPVKSKKRQERDFAERQERAQRILEKHGIKRTQKSQ